jgi:hypothetical protein
MRSRPLDLDLEREIRAAQSVLPKQAAAEAERLEWAQFATCRAVAEALALREPSSGAGAYVSSAGAAIFGTSCISLGSAARRLEPRLFASPTESRS